HPDFVAGAIDTGFIAREGSVLLAGPGAPQRDLLAVAALTVLSAESVPANADPWDEHDLWWLNTTPARVLVFKDGEASYPVSVTRDGAAWRIGDTPGTAECLGGGRLRVSLDGVWRTVTAVLDHQVVTVRANGLTWRLALPDPLAADDDEEDASD